MLQNYFNAPIENALWRCQFGAKLVANRGPYWISTQRTRSFILGPKGLCQVSSKADKKATKRAQTDRQRETEMTQVIL